MKTAKRGNADAAFRNRGALRIRIPGEGTEDDDCSPAANHAT